MNYIKIDQCNMNNGSGLRCVVWLSGCEHHCPGCFNPETWNPNAGDEFSIDAVNCIQQALSQDWCAGVTFTGGDPFAPCNRERVLHYINSLKQLYPTKTVWVYTGYTIEELVAQNVDLSGVDVLCDGRFLESEKSHYKHWVGSANQRVIDIAQSHKKGKLTLYEG